MPKRIGIGVDVGASAVKAAEVVVDGDRRVLVRFAQVGLPQGAVVEGEVYDVAAVTAAIKRLWQHGNFSSKDVVIGLGSQRTMVRQVEMPAMSDSELKSALRFKSGEFLPIPVEQAVVDFASLPTTGGEGDKRRVLLVAAQRDVVMREVAAIEAGGLRVRGVDCSALALLRGTGSQAGSSGEGGLEAVIGVGAEMITIAVREDGVPRFVRTVSLGHAGVFPAVASAPQALGASAAGNYARLRQADETQLEQMANEVRTSMEYLLAQSDRRAFDRVSVTGGRVVDPEVVRILERALGTTLTVLEPSFDVDAAATGLPQSALEEARYRWSTAAGLALWGTDSYRAPTLLPSEVAAKRRQKRIVAGMVAGGCVIILGCGALSVSEVRSGSRIKTEIAAATAQEAALQTKIKGLSAVTKVPAEVRQAQMLAQMALSGDIDWPTLVTRLGTATPSNIVLQNVSFSKVEVQGSGGLWGAAPGSDVIGNITFNGSTKGGAAAVATFIDRLWDVPGIKILWVQQTETANGLTGFSGSADITTAAYSNRDLRLPGEEK